MSHQDLNVWESSFSDFQGHSIDCFKDLRIVVLVKTDLSKVLQGSY